MAVAWRTLVCPLFTLPFRYQFVVFFLILYPAFHSIESSSLNSLAKGNSPRETSMSLIMFVKQLLEYSSFCYICRVDLLLEYFSVCYICRVDLLLEYYSICYIFRVDQFLEYSSICYICTWMGDRQGRPSAVNLRPLVGVDLNL